MYCQMTSLFKTSVAVGPRCLDKWLLRAIAMKALEDCY